MRGSRVHVAGGNDEREVYVGSHSGEGNVMPERRCTYHDEVGARLVLPKPPELARVLDRDRQRHVAASSR